MRPRSPWLNSRRNLWYVWLNGKQTNLGFDKEEAMRKYHSIMAQEPEKPVKNSIVALLDAFCVYCADHKAASTTRWYDDYLQSFIDYLKAHGHKPATMNPQELTPKIVRGWAGQGSKRARITAVKTAYSWALAEGWIEFNPVAGMKRPAAAKRSGMIDKDDMKKILRATKDRCFRDLLIVAYDTGARPQELRLLNPKHLDLANHRIVLTGKDAKGGRTRFIYLTPRAERIITRSGGRFLNSESKPWTASAVKCRFARLEEKLGKRFCQYHLRHAWVTRMLKKEIDSHIVAHLAGHKGTRMIETVYSHVQDDDEFMLAQAMNALVPCQN